MKKINKTKLTAFLVLTGLFGTVLIAFQNFTPIKKPKSDVSDLYMNGALSMALKTKESAQEPEDKKVALREISWADGSSENQKERYESSDEVPSDEIVEEEP